jgi:hypothetical protein
MKDDRLEVGVLVFGFIMVGTVAILCALQAKEELTSIVALAAMIYMSTRIQTLMRIDTERMEVEARDLRIKQRQLERYLKELDKENAAERED